MIGTLINVAAIVTGGAVGLAVRKQFSPRTEYRIKMILGVVTLFVGMKTTWNAIHGSFGSVLKQVMIVLVALILGNLIGKALRIQKGLNKLGEYAKRTLQRQEGMAAGTEGAGVERPPEGGTTSGRRTNRFADGFVTCTLLFCVGPMAIIGALEDGLSGKIQTLAIKSAMDGLATMAFVKTFGIGPIFAAIPVLAYQGTITLMAEGLKPVLTNHMLLDSINATGGLLILCISVVILDIQKVPLADYLPSLVVAPLLTWLFR
jgi:uncharacterized protein